MSLGEYSYVPQFPELAVASYNKNLAAPNDPDGIVAVWNLHLLERPEFVFHSPVSDLPTSIQPMVPSRLVASDMIAPVRRPLRDVLPVPPDPDIRRVLFRPSPPLGHSRQTPSRAQNPVVCRRPHLPHLRDEDGGHAECQQPHLDEYGRPGLFMAGRYAFSATGESRGHTWTA